MFVRTLLRSAQAVRSISRLSDRARATAAFAASALALASLAAAPPAQAADGCVVLLCLAAPNWRSIPQCVPPIRKVLRDLARGRSFPTCAMSGAGNSAGNLSAQAPGNCPPQYTRVYQDEGGGIVYECDYAGAVSVNVDGRLFSRTWWNYLGESVTEFSDSAKAQLGTWDTRFDDDYARWKAWQESIQPPVVENTIY